MGARFAAALAAFLFLAASQANQAGFIVGAASVSSPQGTLPGFPLENIINQSGLSANYVNGATNFAAFTAATTHLGMIGTGFTNQSTNGPQQFTFDLGSVMTIGGIAIWNTDNIGRVIEFEAYADSDDDFGNGLGVQLVALTPLGDFGPAQVFAFGTVETRYVHINGTASLAPPDVYGLGEVAFDRVERNPNQVPEPATLSLIGFGIAGMGLFARARRRN